MAKHYESSGVSLQRGYEAVRRIKTHIGRTKNPGVMSDIGGFGGLFDLAAYGIEDPILVSGTDGVGTKLLVAQAADRHDTVGIDLVAMCVNDIITVGAKPLFFLDYIAIGTSDPARIEQIVSGIAEGCVQAECALIGGETAEMPDLYQEGHYDLAGYATGVVDRKKVLSPESVLSTDLLIGLPSSGLHSNGFSLVRKVFFKDHDMSLNESIEELGTTLQEELLKPTTIYVKPVLDLLAHHDIHAIAHITGGGFHENIPRVLSEGLGVTIHEDALPKLPIFHLLETMGNIPHDEMYHVFNMGIGMVLVVPQDEADAIMERLTTQHAIAARVIGKVTTTPGVVII